MKTTLKKAFRSETDRWNAVVTCDAEADGVFYYSVKTTGVFCRPSCSSRQPLRKNVLFHATAKAARHAGFRPCKRCRPEQTPSDLPQAQAVIKVCRMLESCEQRPPMESLAAETGLSASRLHRVFQNHVGLTPGEYFKAKQSERVRNELSTATDITHAIYRSGYQSNAQFYSDVKETIGMSPTQFRSGGDHVTIRFAIGACSLGEILVAATQRGVCAILLGDDSQEVLNELQDRFPHAELIGGDRDFEKLVGQVLAFVESPQLGVDLPLDIQGTAFQKRVWQAIRKIPLGETQSYSEIAQAIGSPAAARAVANACAANPLAVVIPCHRVVRNDGSVAGYRWSVERRKELLELEQYSDNVG